MSYLLSILSLTLLAVIQISFAQLCGDPNEVYTDCGTACPLTCANMNEENRFCTKQCVSGCFCTDGFVRNDNGLCVPKDKCSPLSTDQLCKDPNESYDTCGTACPVTCQNLANPPRACIMICRQGCFCKAPYVRDEITGRCLPSYLCPRPIALPVLTKY